MHETSANQSSASADRTILISVAIPDGTTVTGYATLQLGRDGYFGFESDGLFFKRALIASQRVRTENVLVAASAIAVIFTPPLDKFVRHDLEWLNTSQE